MEEIESEWEHIKIMFLFVREKDFCNKREIPAVSSNQRRTHLYTLKIIHAIRDYWFSH